MWRLNLNRFISEKNWLITSCFNKLKKGASCLLTMFLQITYLRRRHSSDRPTKRFFSEGNASSKWIQYPHCLYLSTMKRTNLAWPFGPVCAPYIGITMACDCPNRESDALLRLTNQLSLLSDSTSPFPSFVPSLSQPSPSFSVSLQARRIPPLCVVWCSPTTIRELLCAAQSGTFRINHRPAHTSGSTIHSVSDFII